MNARAFNQRNTVFIKYTRCIYTIQCDLGLGLLDHTTKWFYVYIVFVFSVCVFMFQGSTSQVRTNLIRRLGRPTSAVP